jgi:hypothetical protein
MPDSRRGVLLGGAILALLIIRAASAETLVLKNKEQTRIEGRVIEQRADAVVFEHSVNGVLVRSTFAASDVAWIESLAPAARPHTHARTAAKHAEAPTGEYPELETYKKQVIIVLDHSKAMAMSDRYEVGLNVVDSLIDHLPAHARFGVYLLDDRAISIFNSNYVKPTDPTRKRLRQFVERLGPPDADVPEADLVTGLVPALNARPDAVYLVTAGAATETREQVKAIVKAIQGRHPRSKKFPVHVIGILGGHPREDASTDAANRNLLVAIADGLGGNYREMLAAAYEGGIITTPRGRAGGHSGKGGSGGALVQFGQGGNGHFSAGDAAMLQKWRMMQASQGH